jgi:NTE family protein
MALCLRFWLSFLLGCCIIGISSPAFSASGNSQCVNPDNSGRPKIGLVLGGGGARGYAHIGVIKRLEELRVPYDYIAGTSVGSIVGGFLATGMDSDELQGVVRNANWDDLFDDKTQREDLPFRRKSDDVLGLYGPKLGVGEKSNLLPSGVVSGQKILFMFETVASQRSNATNFDQLPIPFRAIATDIVTGDMVVLKRGSLAIAMRASMAVPAVFDPVRQGGKLLVDGGLSRNLPVDVAKSMGADIVIAVDVGTKLGTEEEMTNVLKIVNQMTGLLTVQNTNIQIAAMTPDDVLISPPIGNTISSADFNKMEEAIPLGYEAAVELDEQLKRYSLSEQDYQAWRKQVGSCVQKSEPSIRFVQLDNQSRFSDEVISELIHVNLGEQLDLNQLENDIRQIYGLGFIRQASYQLVEEDGQQGIEIQVLEDSRGTQFIETGMDFSASLRGTEFNIRAAYLNTGLDERGSEFRAMVQLGESPGIFLDYYKPLDDGLKYALRPSLFAFSRPLLLFDDQGDAVAQVDVVEAGGSLKFGREFKRHLGIFAGISRYVGKLDVDVGPPGLDSYDFNGAEMFTSIIYDRLDDRYLPTKGTYWEMEYIYSNEKLGADANYTQVELDYFSTKTFGLHNLMWSGQYYASFADKIDAEDAIPEYAWFTGGGFLNNSGFDPNSLIGPQYFHLLLGYRYQVAKSGFLPGYVGTTLEYGNAAGTRDELFEKGFLNGSVYMAYGSPLGPIYLGVGWSDDRSPIYFLRLGSVLGAGSVGGSR